MDDPSPVAFVGGFNGAWRIDGMAAPVGEALPPAARLAVLEGPSAGGAEGRWVLRGAVSGGGGEGPAGSGRPNARVGALVAVRKSPAWWDLGDDERRRALDGRPADLAVAAGHHEIARRLYDCRHLDEPFDLLAWFEFPPDSDAVFDGALAELRSSQEWSYVEREVDVRVSR